MNVIVYTSIDGKCEVIYPNYNSAKADESNSELVARIAENDIPVGATNVTIIDHLQLPYAGWRDETGTRSAAMRDSWVNPPDTTSPPVVDMDRARQAKMDLEWRPARDEILKQLDVDFMRAVESNDNAEQAKISAEKRKYRDMPADFSAKINAMQTPEELDSYNPVIDIIIGANP